MQESTKRAVLELVRRNRARTRGDLGRRTGLSRSAVAQLVAELLAEGLLAEHVDDRRGIGPGDRPGRPATRLSLARRRGYVAAVDLGHGHLAVALADLHEEVLERSREPWPVDSGPREPLAAAGAELDRMLSRRGARRSDLVAVGIGVPFPVVDRLVAPIGDVPAWEGVRPAAMLPLPHGVRVLVDNVSNLAAWAEFVAAGDGVRVLLYVSAGDGVGGALVVDGQVLAGRHGIGGELGHVAVPGCTLPCRCGRTGCLDALVTAATAPGATSEDVRAAADAFGAGLAQVASFVDPDVIVLGGTASAAGDAGPTLASLAVESFARHGPSGRATILRARFGQDAPLHGALDRATQAAWAGA